MCLFLVALLHAAPSHAAGPGLLVKVDWQSAHQLAAIARLDADVRHCADGYVLLGADAAQVEALRGLRLQAAVLDTSAARTTYCVAQVRPGFEGRVDGLARRVFCDARQRVVLAIDLPETELEPALGRLAGWCWFLYALPHRMSLAGWLAQPALEKPSYTQERSLQVSAWVDSVSAARIERHVARLVYHDPAKVDGHYDNSLDNLRTRYARHPDCRDSAAAYIAGQLAASLGEAAVELVEFRHTPDEVPMYNIVGTLEGTDPDAGHYILCGHYDATAARSVNVDSTGADGEPDTTAWRWQADPTPGADDNASAVACVLEAARILARVTLPFGVKFVCFSGEELHLWGSQAYVADAQARDEPILAVLNLDMVGYNNRYDKLDVVAVPRSKCVMRTMGDINELYDIGLLLFEKYDSGFPSSDHWSFWARGYSGIWATEHLPPWEDDPEGLFTANAAYHTYLDVADSLNFPLMRKVAQLCVATLAHLGVGAPLAPCSPETGPLFEVFAFPNPSAGDEVRFHYQLSELADVRIDVFTAAGQPVWSKDLLSGKAGATIGGTGNEVVWPCTNLAGRQVASGLYVYKIAAFGRNAQQTDSFVLRKLAIAR